MFLTGVDNGFSQTIVSLNVTAQYIRLQSEAYLVRPAIRFELIGFAESELSHSHQVVQWQSEFHMKSFIV